MLQELIIKVKNREWAMYNEFFSFFHSNSINKIITGKKIDQVILYRDLQFFDDETEYLKRTYHESQAFNRIRKLISYYENNMTPPSPNMLTIEQVQYLENRNRKLLKLCIMREKSQAAANKNKASTGLVKSKNASTMHQILPKLNETNLSKAQSYEREDSEEESYDSEAHDVYENFIEEYQGDRNMESSLRDCREMLSTKGVRDSNLIINFKTVHEPNSDQNVQNSTKMRISQPPMLRYQEKESIPEIVIQPPQQPSEIINMPIPGHVTESHTIQNSNQRENFATGSQNTQQSSIKGSQEKMAVKENERLQQGSSQMSSKKSTAGVVSPKKKPSFMDYYNSVPEKKPTNLLEKYIKRKK